MIVFMGTSNLAVPALQWLIASDYRLAAVYTQPDRPAGRGRTLSASPVNRVALDHGIAVCQPATLKDATVIDAIGRLRPDVIVVAAYGKLLPDDLLNIPPHGCINIHPSLLPKHRGPSPVQGALLAGDEHTGVTIILLDRDVDAGPIVAQTKVPIGPEDTAASLSRRLAETGAQLLADTLPGWLSGTITAQPQRHEEASYTSPLSKKEGEIKWHMAAVDLWRRVRALQPWPGSYTHWQGKLLKVIEAAPLPGAYGEPGLVVPLGDGGVGVQTADGVLGLMQVQLEGKRQMSIDEFRRGHSHFVGALLPS